VDPGQIVDEPVFDVSLNGFANSNAEAWLFFSPDIDIPATAGSIQYGIFASEADAQNAFDILVRDIESIESSEIYLPDSPNTSDDWIAWNAPRPGSSLPDVGGAFVRIDNVVVFSYVIWLNLLILAPDDPLIVFALLDTGVNHLRAVTSAHGQSAVNPGGSNAGGMYPRVTFMPQRLDVQLGDTVSVEVAMPTTDFGGLYDLNLLIPPQFQLASNPMCISNAESCVNFEPVVIPQLDGSTAIAISGYYGLSEPGRFAVELDVVDVPQAGGPRVGISAQLVFYTRHVEHDPVDTWLEVNFE
jgi:hypothetical protein